VERKKVGKVTSFLLFGLEKITTKTIYIRKLGGKIVRQVVQFSSHNCEESLREVPKRISNLFQPYIT